MHLGGSLVKNKKRIFIIFLFIIIVALALSVPSRDDFNKWMSQNYNIERSFENRHEIWEKNGDVVFYVSSHQIELGVFMTIEKKFQYENGDEFTIRALGIFNSFFPMEDGRLWEVLN